MLRLGVIRLRHRLSRHRLSGLRGVRLGLLTNVAGLLGMRRGLAGLFVGMALGLGLMVVLEVRIDTLRARLLRLVWGLVLDVWMAEFRTRAGIIKVRGV